jgi:hypothetical protein
MDNVQNVFHFNAPFSSYFLFTQSLSFRDNFCYKLLVFVSLTADAHLYLKVGVHPAPDVFLPTGPHLSPVVCDGMLSASVVPFVG